MLVGSGRAVSLGGPSRDSRPRKNRVSFSAPLPKGKSGMPDYNRLADLAGWHCSDCGKLPCECPISEDEVDLKVFFDCDTHTIAFYVRDEKAEMIVPLNEDEANELALQIAKMLIHFAVAHPSPTNPMHN